MANLREKIALSLLRKHIQSTKSEQLKSLAHVREVGVVYDVKKTPVQVINRVVHHFESEGKTVQALGFVNEKTLEGISGSKGESFFCKKDLNFWKFPKKKSVQDFVGRDFDYLINLDLNGDMTLQAVSTFSKAKTRIGKWTEPFSFAQDFMLKTIAETEEDLFQEIIKYIK